MATSAALLRLRNDLGDSGRPPAFSDAELAVLLDAAGGDLLAARVAGLWQLLTQAAKLANYTVGQGREDRAVVFDHLHTLYETAVSEQARAGVATEQARFEAGRDVAAVSSVAVPVRMVF